MVCSHCRLPGHNITKCQAPGADEKRQESKNKKEKRKSTSPSSSSCSSLLSPPSSGSVTFNLMDAAFVFFDLETTGTNVNTDRMVQIAYEVWHKRIIVKKKTQIISSALTSCPAAVRIHGITSDRMRFGVSLKVAMRDFCRTLMSFEDDGHSVVLVAHNLRFDATILSRELARAQQEALSERESISNMKIAPSLFCLDTLPLLRRTFPDLENHRLGTVYRHIFQKDLEGAHDAAADTAGLACIVNHSTVFCNLETASLYETWELYHRKADGLTLHRCREEIFAAGDIGEDELSDIEEQQDDEGVVHEELVLENEDEETVTSGISL